MSTYVKIEKWFKSLTGKLLMGVFKTLQSPYFDMQDVLGLK
jgi:hypothetical protein